VTPGRLALLRRRCEEIRRRGHVPVDELPHLLAWLDEALRAVPTQAALALEEAA
jgi:hypothetical protein